MPIIWFIILATVGIVFYLLPFIPSINEWFHKTDAKSLDVNVPDRNRIEHRLRLFREYIAKYFAADLKKYSDEKTFHEGKLSNGTEYYISGKDGILELTKNEIHNEWTQKVIVVAGSALLPNNFTFRNKIYVTKDVSTGKDNIIDDLLADGNILLQSGSAIKYSIYSNESINVEQFCNLKGYTKADKEIRLIGNDKFQCLYAPQIVIGNLVKDLAERIPAVAIDIFSLNLKREIYEESTILPEKCDIATHLIGKGNLTIAHSSAIKGNIKSYKNIIVGDHVTLTGALIAKGDIYIGDNCIIQGPIIAEGLLRVGKNCIVGTADTRTSVIGNYIQLLSGSLFFGLLLAKIEGHFALDYK